MPQVSFRRILLILATRLTGLLIVGFSLIFVLALFSFESSDPSFNTVSATGFVSNWIGVFGSYLSDLSFQLIGIAAFFLCLIIFSIGTKMASVNGVKNILVKLILTPPCILSFSIFFARIPTPSWWYFESLGGVNGKFILTKITFMPTIATALLMLVVAVILISIIMEISFADWIYFFRYSFVTTRFLFEKISQKISQKILEIKKQKRERNEILERKYDARMLEPERYQMDSEENNSEVRNGLFIADEDENDGDNRGNFNETEEEQSDEIIQDVTPAKSEKARNIAMGGVEVSTAAAAKNTPVTRQQFKQELNKLKAQNHKSKYQLPTADLLMDRSAENKDKKIGMDLVEKQSQMLLKTLDDFGVSGEVVGAKIGPVVTLHEFEPVAGTKASRVIGLSDDIARSMSAVSARISVVPGKTSLGIELPNPKRQMIFFRELIETKDYKFSQNFLPMILGKDIGGEIVIADLAKMPHLLIAGTTGSGKSVGLNVMILSLLFKLRPDECKFIMIDPKMLELSIYDGIPHLLAPVVTEPAKAVIALKWVVAEMESRYRLLSSLNVRNILGFNEKIEKAIYSGEVLKRRVQTGYEPTTAEPIFEEIDIEMKKLPFIVVIVDEMADLMLVAGKEIEGSVQRLAQMARAAGIHIIMATQRPSVDVITGVIKANFPTRISFQVTSRIDSRTILGVQGAEQLLGQGDMIYMHGGSKMTRVHGPFCSDTEIENIVNFIKDQDLSEFGVGDKVSFEAEMAAAENAKGNMDEDGDGGGNERDLYAKAVAVVKRDKKPSISYVQRQLRIGYNRAASLIERMEEEGIVTAPSVSGKREVIE